MQRRGGSGGVTRRKRECSCSVMAPHSLSGRSAAKTPRPFRRSTAPSARSRCTTAISASSRSCSADRARHFAAVDGYRRYALVAVDPDRPRTIVGMASFDREGDTGRAECALAVADGWQRRGAGLGLIRQLLRAAARRGIGTAYGYVLPDNRAMLGLLGKVGYALRTGYDGHSVCVELDLADLMPDVCPPCRPPPRSPPPPR